MVEALPVVGRTGNSGPLAARWQRCSACPNSSMEGAVPLYTTQTETEALVAEFDSHLRHAAGLLPGTRAHYLRHATLFLRSVFSTTTFDIRKVTPQAITDFICEQSAKLKSSSCAAPSTSMRVFLRFRFADFRRE